MDWSGEEFKTLELGDERLNARAKRLVGRLGGKPTESLPNACHGWAETQAAYRFLSNPRTDWQALLQTHWASSLERMRGHEVVLNLQDTTELDFHGRQCRGLGPILFNYTILCHNNSPVSNGGKAIALCNYDLARFVRGEDIFVVE